MPPNAKTIAITLNSAWNVTNFRWGLLLALRADGHRLLVLTPDGPERARIEAAGLTFVPLRQLSRDGKNPLKDLRLIRELSRIYRRERVDLALHYTIKPVIYGTLAAHRTGVFCVNTITGLGYAFLSRGLVNTLARQLYYQALKRADITLFQNQDDRDYFLRLGLVPAERSGIVHGSGVNIEDFEVAKFPDRSQAHFLFIGRLLADKGIREYVAAARRVKRSYPDAVFHIVGDLDRQNPSSVKEAEIRQWLQEDTVVYHGSSEDVRPFIRDAQFVVLPSYREGLPRVMLEAASMSRPLIATDVPGCREIVRPGLNGWLVPARDAEQLAAVMQRALNTDREQLTAMAAAGRRLVEDVFAEQRIIGRYRAIIQGS